MPPAEILALPKGTIVKFMMAWRPLAFQVLVSSPATNSWQPGQRASVHTTTLIGVCAAERATARAKKELRNMVLVVTRAAVCTLDHRTVKTITFFAVIIGAVVEHPQSHTPIH